MSLRNTLMYGMGLLGEGVRRGRKGEGEYYSAALEAAAEMKQAKGSPQQMIATLAKQKGVKKEEMDYLDLAKEFEGKKSITREELMEAIQDRLPNIGRSTIGLSGSPYANEVQSRFVEGIKTGLIDDGRIIGEIMDERRGDFRIVETPDGDFEVQEATNRYFVEDDKIDYETVETFGDEDDAIEFIDDSAREFAGIELSEGMDDEDILQYAGFPTLPEMFERLPLRDRQDIEAGDIRSEVVPLAPDDARGITGQKPRFYDYSLQGANTPNYREDILRVQSTPAVRRGEQFDGSPVTNHFATDGYVMHTRGGDVTVSSPTMGYETGYLIDEIQSDLFNTARKNEKRGVIPFKSAGLTGDAVKPLQEKLDNSLKLRQDYVKREMEIENTIRDRVYDQVDEFLASKPDLGDKINIPVRPDANNDFYVLTVENNSADPDNPQLFIQPRKKIESVFVRKEDIEGGGDGYTPLTSGQRFKLGTDRGELAMSIARSDQLDQGDLYKYLKTGNPMFKTDNSDGLNLLLNEVQRQDIGFDTDLANKKYAYEESLYEITPELLGRTEGYKMPDISNLTQPQIEKLQAEGLLTGEGNLVNPLQFPTDSRSGAEGFLNNYAADVEIAGVDPLRKAETMSNLMADRVTTNPTLVEVLEEQITQDMLPDDAGFVQENPNFIHPDYFTSVPNAPMPNAPFKKGYTGLGIKEGLQRAARRSDVNYVVLPDPQDSSMRYGLQNTRLGDGLESAVGAVPTNKVIKDLGLNVESRDVAYVPRGTEELTEDKMKVIRMDDELRNRVLTEGLPLFSLGLPAGYMGYNYLSNVPPAPEAEPSGLLDDVLSYPAEFNSGLVDALASGVDFFTTDTINAVSELAGSDFRVPRLSDQPIVKSYAQGGYVENPYAREAVRFTGGLLSPF